MKRKFWIHAAILAIGLPLSSAGASFVSSVGTATAPQAVTVNITTAGTLNSIQVVTGGAPNLDFTQASGGTCATGTAYAATQSCTVNVVFDPVYSGTRNGAVLLADAAGNVLGTTYVSGFGNGPQIGFQPPVDTGIGASGLRDSYGVAVDGNGNVYIPDYTNAQVIKETRTAGGYTQSTLFSICSNTIAVDGAGSVYLAVGSYGAAIYKETPSAGGYVQSTVPTSTLNAPYGLAVDGSGNVYVSDEGHNRVLKETLGASGYVESTVASGLNHPTQIAVDGSGNVYIADQSNLRVLKETLQAGGTYVQSQIGSGFNSTMGVAVDGNGNVFVSNALGYNTGEVLEFPWTGTGYGAQSVIYTANTFTGYPGYLAVDGGGNVYVGVIYNTTVTRLRKLDAADPPSLSFASTAVGSTSSDSPKTVTVANIGNTALTLANTGANPSYPANFPVNSADSNLCNSSTSLAVGAVCDVSVNFSPTVSGSLSGYVVVTDNDLNGVNITQPIPVDGTATPPAGPAVSFSPTALVFPNTAAGTTATALTTTLSNTGNAALTGIGLSISGANPSYFSVTGTTCGATLAASASCTISVSFTPAAATSYSAVLSVADNATGSPQTVPLTGTGTAPQASLSPTTLAFPNTTAGTTATALTTTLSNTGNAALTGIGLSISGANPSYFSVTGTTCGATLAASASCTISVSFTPAAAASYSAILSIADNAGGSPQTVALSGTGTVPPDYSVSASPGSETVQSGTAAVFTITVQSSGGSFGGTVSLTATGLPTGATAVFSPAQLSPGSGSATSTLTVTTPAIAFLEQKERGLGWPMATPVLAVLLVLPLRRRRKAWTGTLFLLAAGLMSMAAAASLTGCGGGFALTRQSQSYSLTITGASGSSTHSTTVQLTVQ